VLLGLTRPERQLNDFLARVSDPRSPAYRRYLPVSALKRRFGATPRTVWAVRQRMAADGVPTALGPPGLRGLVTEVDGLAPRPLEPAARPGYRSTSSTCRRAPAAPRAATRGARCRPTPTWRRASRAPAPTRPTSSARPSASTPSTAPATAARA
jgi:hypothetical protein